MFRKHVLLSLFASMLLLSGCASSGSLVRSDITVGKPVSDDTVRGHIRVASWGNQKTYEKVFHEVVAVIEGMGIVHESNKEKGLGSALIKALIRGGEANIILKYIPATIQLDKIEISVTSRQGEAADLELAKDIYNRIIEKIRFFDNKPTDTVFIPVMIR